MNKPRILFWHRKDLRIFDNQGLIKAFSLSNAITSTYKFDKNYSHDFNASSRAWFLGNSLQELGNNWEKMGSRLILKELKKLERFFGREETPNGKKWLSRCLDLDILWWEDFYTVDEELTLPHPRFMNRYFVITPLSEILSRSQKIKKFDDPKWSIK